VNLTAWSLRNPYAVLAAALVVTALGIWGLLRTPADLFPDTVPPQVTVITIRPGSSAGDVTDKVTRILEKELNRLPGVINVISTTRDEVSSINVEFDYKLGIGQALLEAQNAISRVRGELPEDVLEPRLFKITDATRPLATLALSPREGSMRTLDQIRLLADNAIKDAIIGLPGIADVEVFGAHQPEIQVRVRRDDLRAQGLTLSQIVVALAQQNVSAPAGTIDAQQHEYLVKVWGEFQTLEQVRDLPLQMTGQGLLRVRHVAEVELSTRQPRSIYHGNGKPAIALNVLRPDHGPTVEAIQTLKAFLPQLEARYPDILFEVTDDQQPLIDVNMRGMKLSLAQAILITVLVIFYFLADARAAAVVSVSIPLSFLASLMVLWLSPYTLNMVTLSGMIIAVGMVVDASVVVLENIYRNWKAGEQREPAQAAQRGSQEVALEITAGMLTTVVVLVPVMFTGGYTQQVMRPLALIVVTTLIASLLAALTVVPLVSSLLLKRRGRRPNLVERLLSQAHQPVNWLTRFYLAILRPALTWRGLTLLLAFGLLIVTMRVVMPLLGGELMPPMDTGISIIEFDTPTYYAPKQVEQVLSQVEAMIYGTPGVKMVSAVAGSEPGAVSFGGGGATAQSGQITIHLVDRTRRSQTIWEIQDRWREELRAIPGIRSSRISEYGATPSATTKAPLNVIISGPDAQVISLLGGQAIEALRGMPGLVDVRRSWYFDKTEYSVEIDPALARSYQTSPAEIATELRTAVQGLPATMMRLEGMLDLPIRVQFAAHDLNHPDHLEEVYVPSPYGPAPLRAMAQIQARQAQPFVTRERLRNTLDITAVNRIYTIKEVAAMAQERLNGLSVPQDYRIEVTGSASDMAASQSSMVQALVIGLVLLYILLMMVFKSFLHPLTILAAIPLAVAGALWGLLLFDKPMCQPALMGLVLLGGTVINNSILLLGFIIKARAEGIQKEQAIVQSVRLRSRPILMTTASTVLGLTPLVFEMAVGLERMSPLGIAAATGLLAGTFMTMIVVPVIYSVLDSAKASVQERTLFWLTKQ
jgi:multidrug efflux pump subunit AcrB